MFLVDENLPESLAHHLNRLGFNAAHVRRLNLGSTADENIWQFAIENSLVVVSKDSDFIDMALYTAGARLLLLRVGNCSTDRLKDVMDKNSERIKLFLSSGQKVLVVTE